MTTRSSRWRAIFALLVPFWADYSFAELLADYPVSLSAADHTQVADLACRQPVGAIAERFDARRAVAKMANGSRPIFVYVICAPHSSMLGHKVKRIAQCDNYYGRWSCTAGDFLEYGAWPGPNYLELNRGNDIATDLEVVKSLLSIKMYRGHDLAELMNGQSCSLHPKSQDRWELECGVTTISVARDCTKDSCSYQPINIDIPLV